MVIRVSPEDPNSTHDISLSNGSEKIGFKTTEIRDLAQTPSTLRITGGGTKFGDWDPTFSHIQQETWEGGRAQETFADDPTRFFDSMNAWTLTPNKLMPAMQWKFPTGLRDADFYLPGDMKWVKLLGSQRYVAVSFEASASYDAANIYLWLRRVGNPGTLTLRLHTDDGGDPDTVLQTKTVTTATITDIVSVFHLFELDTAESLTSGTTYHISVYSASTDIDGSHWEVGVDEDGAGSQQSADGSTWAGAAFTLYYRVTDADIERKFHYFWLDNQFYCVDERDDETAAKIYMLGWRGIATAGTTTTLEDTEQTWTVDELAGLTLKLITGKGKSNRQYRTIASNTADTITVSPAFSVTPDTTTEYVILGGTKWIEVGTTGLTKPVYDVTSVNDVAYFAQGDATNIRRMRFNSATPAHQFADDGTNKADLIYSFYDPTDGPVVWRALNGKAVYVDRSNSKEWGTNLSFGDNVKIGDYGFEITGITDFSDQLWVFKEDSVWTVKNKKAAKLNVGLDSMPSPDNGAACVAQNLFLYFSWSHSLERMQGGTLDDMGPWKDAGLPDNRRGPITKIEPVIGWLLASVDAGSGYSSVLAWNTRGWHEMFRGFTAGKSIRNIKWQPVPGMNPKLWINIGGEMVYQEWPKDTLNPLRDANVNFQHEFEMISSTIDMGASQLPKFIEELSLISANEDNIRIEMDYQVDEKVGSTSWITAGEFHSVPEDVVRINEGNRRRVRYRLRALTEDAQTPPVVDATVLKGAARIPEKRQYSWRSSLNRDAVDYQGNVDMTPTQIVERLRSMASNMDKLTLRSRDKIMDNITVFLEPDVLNREIIDQVSGQMEATISLTVREA